MPSELVQRVRSKFPGVYDDLDDATLEARVLAKFPDYQDLATPKPETPATTEPGLLSQVGSAIKDVAIGAAKGLGHSAIGAGRLVEAVTPIERLTGGIPANAEAALGLDPANTMQRVGMGAEQIAEFFTPAGGAGKVKLLAEAAKSALLTGVQTGSPTQSAASAGIAAAIPSVGAAARNIVPALREGAIQKVVQALGPTKERYKAIAERLAPEILKRGLGGSRKAIQAQAQQTLETVGSQLDDALLQHGADRVSTKPVVDALEAAKDAFRTTVQKPISAVVGKRANVAGVNGNVADVIVEFEPRAIRQLSRLQGVIAELGDDATIAQLTAVRRAWDKVVSQAGGYQHRTGGAIGVPLKDQSEAFAKREGAGAIRKLLAEAVPDLAAINKEYSFWKGLDDVVTQTLQRTKPQGKGLGRIAAEGAGQVVGGMAGSAAGPAGAVGGAILVGKLAETAKALFTSPRWKLVDARLRNGLADAIASDHPGKIRIALARIATALPAQYRPAVGQ